MARYNSVVRKLNKYKYIVDGKLTGKGYFSSKIYADEIAMGEIFATDFVKNIDEYQILLLLAALVYEHRETTEFKREFKSEKQKELWKLLINNEFLKREKKFDNLNKVGVFIHPVYNGKTFFEVINLTNLQEGDIIRIYAQILDRIGQIKKAATDSEVITKMENCQGIIQKVLEGIWLV